MYFIEWKYLPMKCFWLTMSLLSVRVVLSVFTLSDVYLTYESILSRKWKRSFIDIFQPFYEVLAALKTDTCPISGKQHRHRITPISWPSQAPFNSVIALSVNLSLSCWWEPGSKEKKLGLPAEMRDKSIDRVGGWPIKLVACASNRGWKMKEQEKMDFSLLAKMKK